MSLWNKIILALSIIQLFTIQQTSSLTMLGRKSTAKEVLAYLSKENQLAEYAKSRGTVVVTGGNSGIGVETVGTLASSGMKVILCARNLESANSVKKSLPISLQELVDVQYLDLSDLSSVKEASEAIRLKYKNIDCLVNNAGIMALPKRQETKDGIELQFGTNHVGHHYLTRLLLPIINENGRIVTVASTAHTMASSTKDWNSEKKYSGWGTYGKSKLANILFAKRLQEFVNNEVKRPDLTSVSLHPGVIRSPLWKHTLPSFLQPAVSLFADKNIEQGAATNVYCALTRNVIGGAYYSDCAMKEPSAKANNVDIRNDLWTYTESILEDKGFGLSKSGVADESKKEAVASS